MDDLLELIIYIAIGVVGLLASAYRNKQKRQTQSKPFPRDIEAESMPDVHPDLGPLAEIFGIPEVSNPRPVKIPEPTYESVEEDGYLVEEQGVLLETSGAETELFGERMESEGMLAEKTDVEGTPVFKSTDAVLISDTINDLSEGSYKDLYSPISDSEIKGISDLDQTIESEPVDWKKAVIYAEILKRREI
jgi:hypothetical protein